MMIMIYYIYILKIVKEVDIKYITSFLYTTGRVVSDGTVSQCFFFVYLYKLTRNLFLPQKKNTPTKNIILFRSNKNFENEIQYNIIQYNTELVVRHSSFGDWFDERFAIHTPGHVGRPSHDVFVGGLEPTLDDLRGKTIIATGGTYNCSVTLFVLWLRLSRTCA